MPNPYTTKLNIAAGKVDLSHGGGGRAMAQLIDELFVKHFDNDLLRQRNDQALFTVPAGRLVISTDGHVISPLFFPGGDIGSLAVHGTVNDVAMSGAKPLYLAAGFILEEGFPLADLEKIVVSMAAAAKRTVEVPAARARCEELQHLAQQHGLVAGGHGSTKNFTGCRGHGSIPSPSRFSSWPLCAARARRARAT